MVKIGDGTVSSARLTLYDNAWLVTLTYTDGRALQPGIWTDQLLRDIDGRKAFVRTQGHANPQAGLIQDAVGNLYGTTYYGGAFGNGVVFKLDTTGVETVLHTFTGKADGSNPAGPLVRDKAGNLYGTTTGFSSGSGTVFKITP